MESNNEMAAFNDALKSQMQLQTIMKTGYAIIDVIPVCSFLYFAVLHQLLKLMISNRFGSRLREANSIARLEISGYKAFESLSIYEQAKILIKAVWLLNEWPQRFISICKRLRLFSSALLRDFEPAPFWYWKIVMEALYHPDRVVTEDEIRNAIRFMENQRITVSELALSRLLGVRQVFRKRTLKLCDLLNTEKR